MLRAHVLRLNIKQEKGNPKDILCQDSLLEYNNKYEP